MLPKSKRIRSVRKHKLIYRDDDGHLKEFQTCHTLWYLLYVNQEPRNYHQRKFFDQDFNYHILIIWSQLNIFQVSHCSNNGYPMMVLMTSQMIPDYLYWVHCVIWEEDGPLMILNNLLAFQERVIHSSLMYLFSMEVIFYMIDI